MTEPENLHQTLEKAFRGELVGQIAEEAGILV